MSNPFGSDGYRPDQPQSPDQGYQQYQQPYSDPFAQVPAAPGYLPQPYGQPGQPVLYAQKSKIAAALLAFFLGNLGVHNFYLGFTAKAGWQLGLTIFGWATAIFVIGLPFIGGVWIWSFVEFIMILAGGGSYRTDANGVPLTS